MRGNGQRVQKTETTTVLENLQPNITLAMHRMIFN